MRHYILAITLSTLAIGCSSAQRLPDGVSNPMGTLIHHAPGFCYQRVMRNDYRAYAEERCFKEAPECEEAMAHFKSLKTDFGYDGGFSNTELCYEKKNWRNTRTLWVL